MNQKNKKEIYDWLLTHNQLEFMNRDFERIKKGFLINDILESYDNNYINNMIKFFEQKEEFEKCNFLIKKINYGK